MTPKTARARAYRAAFFAACLAADALVLREVLTEVRMEPGQFGRGYFEASGGDIELVADDAIDPDMLPAFALAGDDLGVSPGMTVVVPLLPGPGETRGGGAAGVDYNMHYSLVTTGDRAPYAVIASAVAPGAAAGPGSWSTGAPVRLDGARAMEVRDGRLALAAWDPGVPWSIDAARLSALQGACVIADAPASLTVAAAQDRVEIRYGRCALDAPWASATGTPVLASLSGPDWSTVRRHPGWRSARSIAPVVALLIVAKVAAIWWAAGGAVAVTLSLALALASWWLAVPAMLVWGMLSIGAAVVAGVRGTVLALRRAPRRQRLVLVLVALAVLGLIAAIAVSAARPSSIVRPIRADHGPSPRCLVVGYSTVAGDGLRAGDGGIRHALDEDCAPCRWSTGTLAAGGETLSWVRDAYCAVDPSVTAGGRLVFLGGANDDFLWGRDALPRLFVAARHGAEPWRDAVTAAAAASLVRMDLQLAALGAVAQCARDRAARFVFLHDFLVTDLAAGREEDRERMKELRRAAVRADGGTFVDLLERFGDEAGVAWFNDYVHLSAIGHAGAARAACAAEL